MPDTNGRTSPETLATAETQAAIEAVVEAETIDAAATAAKPRRRRSPKATGPRAEPRAARRVPVMAVADQADEVVRAESVSITQGGIGEAHADRIDVRMGGIGRAEAREISVVQGGLGVARADHVQVSQGVLWAAMAERIELRQGISRFLVARGPVRIEQSFARTVVAQDVEIGERGFAGLVIARGVSGGGRILLDWRAGLALGAAFALVWALIRGGRPRA
jgi:hypothetical protein